MADMDIKIKVTGTLDREERRAFARWLGMEGEPVADIRAEVERVIGEHAWGMLAGVIEEEGRV